MITAVVSKRKIKTILANIGFECFLAFSMGHGTTLNTITYHVAFTSMATITNSNCKDYWF